MPGAGSVPEVADAGEHHRDAGGVGGCDDLGVAARAAGLDRRGGAGPDRRFEPVGERVERVRGDDRAALSPAPARPALAAVSAAFWAAMRTLSTRLIWPAPMPTVAPPRAKTIAFDLTCFATVSANSRSAISDSVGARLVTTFSIVAGRGHPVALLDQQPARDFVRRPALGFRVGQPAGHQQPQRLLAARGSRGRPGRRRAR